MGWRHHLTPLPHSPSYNQPPAPPPSDGIMWNNSPSRTARGANWMVGQRCMRRFRPNGSPSNASTTISDIHNNIHFPTAFRPSRRDFRRPNLSRRTLGLSHATTHRAPSGRNLTSVEFGPFLWVCGGWGGCSWSDRAYFSIFGIFKFTTFKTFRMALNRYKIACQFLGAQQSISCGVLASAVPSLSSHWLW